MASETMNDEVFANFRVQFPTQVNDELHEAYGEDHWTRIQRALATPPTATSVRVNQLYCDTKTALSHLEQALKPFNDYLQSSQRDTIHPYVHPVLSDVIIIPSAHQTTAEPIAYNPRQRSIVVDRLCGEAVLRGSDIYCRGIMSASTGLQYHDRVNIYVDLDHCTTRGSNMEGHSGRKLLIAHGTMQMGRSEMFHLTQGLAVDQIVRVCADAPPLNGLVPTKLMYVQNLPSTVAAHVLDPQPGETIIDMCSAPGGKTTHLANLMGNKGTVIACDQSKKKVIALKQLVEEMQVDQCIIPLRLDSMHSVLPKGAPSQSVAEVIASAREQFALNPPKHGLLPVKGFSPETFDRILLDPPCSALGLRPRLLHKESVQELGKYPSMQRTFLWCAVYLLKPGGTLVYSTCTIHPNENERMVKYALDNYPLELEQQSVRIGSTGLTNQGLSEEEASKVQRFDPSDESVDSIGFFCARFRKTKSVREL